jgi:hypothetical protein
LRRRHHSGSFAQELCAVGEELPGSEATGQVIRQVCILAVPRTGSTYLNQLLGCCPEFNNKSELFHKNWVGEISDVEMALLRKKSGGVIRDKASLCAWRATHVRQTLNTLYKAGGEKPVLFKLFPGHLEMERASRAIMARDGAIFIVLRRRPIEIFISSLKAIAAGTYSKVDTTAIKPALSVEPFLKWRAKTMSWYRWVDAEIEAHGLPHFELGYERHLEGLPPEAALSTVLGKLKNAGLAVALPENFEILERQDREGRYQDRVVNWAEFEARMRADPERAEILSWAETAP